MTDTQNPIGPDQVIQFWFDAGPEKWFERDDGFDKEIVERFSDLYRQAAEGELDDWSATARGSLGLVLILDQFSRNMFRQSERAFTADHKALSVSEHAIQSGLDAELSKEERTFLYMPFMHAESRDVQDRGVVLFHQLGEEENLEYAKIHRDVILRFGRFPHRNAALGRHTSPAEQAFLDGGGFSA